MTVGLNQPPHFVWVAFDEEVHGPWLADIFFYFEQKSLGIHGSSECIRKRAQVKIPLGIHEVQNLRPAKQVIGSADSGGIGRQEFGEQGNENKDCEKRHAYQSQSMFFELPPHQLELRSGIVPDLHFSGNAGQGWRWVRDNVNRFSDLAHIKPSPHSGYADQAPPATRPTETYPGWSG